MTVLRNIGLLAICPLDGGQGAIDSIPDAVVAWEEGTITWVGPEADLPDRYALDETMDARGRLVVPGLVDCHTHLAFGGWRADEFEQRIRGASYLEIAQLGGGILSTVAETRALSEDA